MAFVHTTRRGFLLGAGAALVALPFVELLSRRKARGDVPRTADRVLFFYYPHGKFDPYWDVDGSDDTFTLRKGSIIEPLAPFAKKLVFLRGLEFKDADNHNGGMRAMLRAGGDANTVGEGASIDWYLATRIGMQARFPWLGLGAIPGGWGTDFGTCPFYKAPFVFQPAERSPLAAWDRLFGDLGQDPAVLHRNRRRQNVIDRVRGDLVALRERLGSEERQKLDLHVSAIAQLEHRLQVGAAPGCQPVPAPPRTDPNANALFPTVMRQQIDLAVAALSCGLTRVACVQLTHTASPLVMEWAPIKTSTDHHLLSHSEKNDLDGIATFVACQRYFMEQFAYLLGRMEGTPDPVRGGSLLDSTTVVLCTEMGDPQLHKCVDVPFAIAGGGGYFKSGRYLDTKGAPHQQLLVSVCHSLGLDNDTFGRFEYKKGELPGIAA